MSITETQLYDALWEKLGEDQARHLTAYVEEKVRREMDLRITHLATKEDVVNAKVEVIKWMFIFWIGQTATVLAIVKFF